MRGTSLGSSSSSDSYVLGRWFTAARRQGLLAVTPAEAWHTLSCVLSFTGRDGARHFTTDQVALSLVLPRDEALRRLTELASTQWRGQPLVTLLVDESGEVTGAELGPLELLAGVSAAQDESSAAPLPALPPDEGAVVSALAAVGLRAEQIEWLTRSFPVEQIQRQLEWLPKRGARNPAALLLRAVEGNWAAPKEDL